MKIVTVILFLPLICLGGAAGVGAGNGGGSDKIVVAVLSIFAIYAIPASIIYFILSIIIFVNNNRIASMLDIGSDDFMNEIINNLVADGSINYRIPLASIIGRILSNAFLEKFGKIGEILEKMEKFWKNRESISLVK